MQAAEVLEALRQNVEEPTPPGEWAEAAPTEDYREFVGSFGLGHFYGILHHLKTQGYYRPIDDFHGEVKMDDRYFKLAVRSGVAKD